MERIFNLKQTPKIDESIDRWEYVEYTPDTGINLNEQGDIYINIHLQDTFTQPSESYIKVKGRLLKSDGTSFEKKKNHHASLTNNGVMYLFNKMRYLLADQEIENVNNVGHATTMLGLLKYPDDFCKTGGMNQCWCRDHSKHPNPDNNEGFKIRQFYIIEQPVPPGHFSFVIPLKHIFGFCEDYEKVMYGMKQTLTFTRTTDKYSLHVGGTSPKGKVELSKISWFMPHVTPNDENKYKLYRMIENKEDITVMYRSRQCETINVAQSTEFTWRLSVRSAPEKPSWVIIGFQSRDIGLQEENSAIFDNMKLKSVCVRLNSTEYPEKEYDLNYSTNDISRAYHDICAFKNKYYNIDNYISGLNIPPTVYNTLFPIYAIDVSKQRDRLKMSVIDMQINATFAEVPPITSKAYALVINDRKIILKSDGKKLNVIF